LRLIRSIRDRRLTTKTSKCYPHSNLDLSSFDQCPGTHRLSSVTHRGGAGPPRWCPHRCKVNLLYGMPLPTQPGATQCRDESESVKGFLTVFHAAVILSHGDGRFHDTSSTLATNSLLPGCKPCVARLGTPSACGGKFPWTSTQPRPSLGTRYGSGGPPPYLLWWRRHSKHVGAWFNPGVHPVLRFDGEVYYNLYHRWTFHRSHPFVASPEEESVVPTSELRVQSGHDLGTICCVCLGMATGTYPSGITIPYPYHQKKFYPSGNPYPLGKS
jgi:hypothetical protein